MEASIPAVGQTADVSATVAAMAVIQLAVDGDGLAAMPLTKGARRAVSAKVTIPGVFQDVVNDKSCVHRCTPIARGGSPIRPRRGS